jgi:hypothetical protein
MIGADIGWCWRCVVRGELRDLNDVEKSSSGLSSGLTEGALALAADSVGCAGRVYNHRCQKCSQCHWSLATDCCKKLYNQGCCRYSSGCVEDRLLYSKLAERARRRRRRVHRDCCRAARVPLKVLAGLFNDINLALSFLEPLFIHQSMTGVMRVIG